MNLERRRVLATASVVWFYGCTESPQLPALGKGGDADSSQSDIVDELDPASGSSALSGPSGPTPSGQSTPSSGFSSSAPPPQSCLALKGSACTTCCKLSFPLVDATMNESLGRCLCASPAECVGACGGNYCSGKPPTAACSTCITQSKVCAPAAKAACDAAPGCTPYMTCMSSCG